jgi:hypothetical protein
VIDVHAVAEDQLSAPIASWAVLSVRGGERLATIRRQTGDRYAVETVFGETSTHGGLVEARDWVANAFSPPGPLQ